MRDGAQFAFGGSGLHRAADLRAAPAHIATLLAAPGARVLPLWRGKPLFTGAALAWLAPGHATLSEGREPLVFLGAQDGQAWFAQDISGWEPDATEARPAGFFDPSEQHHPMLGADTAFADLRSRMAALAPRDAELAAMARALLGWHGTHGFCAVCGSASEATHAGWQRKCPACGAQHFPRTDPVVIMLITRGNEALIGRSPEWPEGMYSCLAGFVEPGETVEAAVRREVAEEVGVTVGEVTYVASQPWPFPSSLMLGCHGRAEDAALTIDPTEIEAARWISREELLEVFSGKHPEIRAPRRGAIAGELLRQWLADRLR